MKAYIKYIITAVFIIICIGSLFIIKDEISSKKEIYTSEILIMKDDIEYEIKVNNKSKITYYRENLEEEILTSLPRTGVPRMSIPVFDKVEEKDVLSDKQAVIDFTYSVSYLEGTQYLKYLINKGYVIEMYACTSQYFECFLKNDEQYKRVILFNNSMMVCDMALGVELPSVESYLKNYNYNSFIDKKFSDKE